MMIATATRLMAAAVLATAASVALPAPAAAQTARERYSDAQAREEKARKALDASPEAQSSALLADARAIVAAYEALVRRFPVSGYSDNALLNAAALSEHLHQRFSQQQDFDKALTLYRRVAAEYPASSLIKQSSASITRLENGIGQRPATASPAEGGASVPARSASASTPRAKLTSIERTVLPEAVRVTIALDREVPYHEETLAGPARVFFDLKGVEASAELMDAVLRYPSDIVRQIRIGRHPQNTVRVVLDLEGVTRHSVYALYNPFRLVVECEPVKAAAVSASVVPATAWVKPAAVPPVPAATRAVTAPMVPTSAAEVPEPDSPVPARATTPPASATPAPEAPSANVAGGFSLARQLGLGVSRIVIDPGHGGHDPGAQVKELDEAALTLDIALRLEKLLQEDPGLEVVLTRRTNVYIPLEERTAIANREAADVFLSIHANASGNAAARGVETYFLSFASSPEAEAVAARENSASAGEMHNLPEIIKAITLNNKLDESKDLAGMVQESLVTRLRRSNKNLRNLGVKKAPFVVLIGASMPSVLAEVSFLTNKQELQLLKTAAYKQRIAEALHAAVLRYRRSLKGAAAIAAH